MNGGIGTAIRNLAYKLAPVHNVTVLFTIGPQAMPGSTKTWAEWQEVYRAKGVTLEAIPMPQTYAYFSASGSESGQRSFEAYMWLKDRESEFDVVHFPEWSGPGFWMTQAKRTGLCCANITLVSQTHSSSIWALEGNDEVTDWPGFFDTDFLERKSTEGADVVISPSNYLLDWMADLPPRSLFHPNAIFESTATSLQPRTSQPTCLTPVNAVEFIFFGRLEKRKGLFLFLDAVTRLASTKVIPTLNITLLGSLVETTVVPLDAALVKLRNAAATAGVSFTVHMQTGLNSEQASKFLLSRPCGVAVIPSLVENLPFTVMECLSLGVPLLVSRVGGNAELFHPDDVPDSTFPASVDGLYRKLVETLHTRGAVQARANPNVLTIDSTWSDWHGKLLPPPVPPLVRNQTVKVSVVMTTYNQKPLILREAVESLANQTYPAELLELILVDDGSADPLSLSGMAELEPLMASRGWRILHIPNSYLGAARNFGMANTTGQLFMFMDDDNVAKPIEIEIYVQAWRHGFDILTCLVDEFTNKVPAPGTRGKNRYLPTGNTELSWLTNSMGDANFFLSRDVWDLVGPFSEDRLAFEDWEFLHKATMLGVRHVVVAEALFWKRISKDSMLKTQDAKASTLRAFRPSFLSPDPALRMLYVYAKAAAMKNELGAATVVMHSFNDFSRTQGFNNLHYMYRPANITIGGWVQLPRVNLPPWAHDEQDWWHTLSDESPLALSSAIIHPSAAYDAAKVWRSRVDGVIHILGEVAKVDAGGDGVNFAIQVGNATVFHRFLTMKLTFKVSVFALVEVGDEVAFLAHAGKTHENDSLWTQFSIEYKKGDRELPPQKASEKRKARVLVSALPSLLSHVSAPALPI